MVKYTKIRGKEEQKFIVDGREDLKRYYLTRHWRKVKKEAYEFYGKKCMMCGNEQGTQVHHKSYENLWNEQITDVEIMCIKCHKEHHGEEYSISSGKFTSGYMKRKSFKAESNDFNSANTNTGFDKPW